MIYLSHPKAKELMLGCAGRNYSNQLFAKADSRKPSPEFLDLVASAAAIIFTQPKDNMLKGATRCIKQMGIFRGDDVSTRYRRLDMRCDRTKTDASPREGGLMMCPAGAESFDRVDLSPEETASIVPSAVALSVVI